jgi:hypothetical protein
MRYYSSHGGGGEGVDVRDSIVHRQCNIPVGLLFTDQVSNCPFRYCMSSFVYPVGANNAGGHTVALSVIASDGAAD